MSFRIACIIDTEGWAWDRTSRELLTAGPSISGEVFLAKDIHNLYEKLCHQFDVIIVYPWAAKDLLRVLEPLAFKTIVCNCSGAHNNKESIENFRKWIKHFKFIGANNEIIRNLYQSAFPEKCVIVLSHGVDIERFYPDPIRAPPIDQELVLGWAGNASRELKRFDKAQKIVEILMSKGIKVNFKPAIYGTESQIPMDEMPNYYRTLNAFLITSRAEAHPLVAYEAMASGLPLVTTNVGDLNDTVINGVNGVILDVDTPAKKFADVLWQLCQTTSVAKRMGRAARQTILQRWSWPAVLPQYETLIQLVR